MTRRVRLATPPSTPRPGTPPRASACAGCAGAGPGRRADRATLYEIPPGQAVCPYHYEYGEEEWALVLEGRPSVRTPEGVRELEPLDLVFFPPGRRARTRSATTATSPRGC